MLLAEAQASGARLAPACEVLDLSARTIQRWSQKGNEEDRRHGPRTPPDNALSEGERRRVLSILHSARYRELPPAQVVPLLADRGIYVASESTMQRLLRARNEAGRRDGARPHVSRPPRRHTATGPNQVWCWDITLVPSTIRGTHFYVYVVMDLFSRRIMGFDVRTTESSGTAAALMKRICMESGVDASKLVLHSDNGSPMRGQTMLATLRWLGITPSFSRPLVSNDNAYVESLFRTAKYRPATPTAFDSLGEVHAWMSDFARWYNQEHRHSGIRYVTPDQRYSGADVALLAAREAVYARAKATHPERWIGPSRNWSRPEAVRLNHSTEDNAKSQAA